MVLKGSLEQVDIPCEFWRLWASWWRGAKAHVPLDQWYVLGSP